MSRAHNFNNLEGKIFGRLKVEKLSAKSKPKKIYWECVCECGNIVTIISSSLISGNTKSCGCLRKELTSSRRSTHKKSFSSEYNTYHHMIKRCYSKNHNSYDYYGGRGITVCERWLESFENFYEDVGEKPSKKHSLDRIDNDGNYEPSNCRWATQSTQVINSRRKKGKSGYKYIYDTGSGYKVDFAREYNRRISLTIKAIEDTIELRDLWLREYEEDKEKWIEDTINKTYKRESSGMEK